MGIFGIIHIINKGIYCFWISIWSPICLDFTLQKYFDSFIAKTQADVCIPYYFNPNPLSFVSYTNYMPITSPKHRHCKEGGSSEMCYAGSKPTIFRTSKVSATRVSSVSSSSCLIPHSVRNKDTAHATRCVPFRTACDRSCLRFYQDRKITFQYFATLSLDLVFKQRWCCCWCSTNLVMNYLDVALQVSLRH